MNRRVAVTGIGVISAIGNNRTEFWQSLRTARCGIRPIEMVDRTQLNFQYGAEVFGFDPAKHFKLSQLALLDRFAQFGVVAAREAVCNAGLEWTAKLRARTCVITGSCIGGQTSLDSSFADLYLRQRPGGIHPLTILRTMMHAAASHISLEFGLTGPSFTISTGCSSSAHAISQGFMMLRQGQAEAAIVGGSDATFSPLHLKAWEALGVIAQDTCRPFSKGRAGMILGEGGAMMVLEPLQAALARGARVYAEIVGCGLSSDAHHLTRASIEGPAHAMNLALQDAGLRPEQIGYINAQGTGTQTNDITEVAAIRAVFGKQADKLAVSSTKSMHGHTLGAAGAIEACATVLALQQRVLPPTVNYLEPDPQCDLDVIPNAAREAEVEYALSNSFAFGGSNAVLAFRRWNDTLA